MIHVCGATAADQAPRSAAASGLLRASASRCCKNLGFCYKNLPAKGLFSYDRHTQGLPHRQVQADLQALITAAQTVLQTMLKPATRHAARAVQGCQPKHAPCSMLAQG